MYKQLLVFCAVLAVGFAAQALGPLEPKPDKYKNVEGCYITELDSVIPFEQSRPSNTECKEYRCSEESVQHISCGAVVASPPLKVVQDLSRPYPDCCPKVVQMTTTGSKAENTNNL